MDDIITYVTENPIIAGGAAGGVVLLLILLMLAGGGKKKNKEKPAAPTKPPRVEDPPRAEPAPARAAEPAPAPRPAPAAAPAPSTDGTPGDLVFAAANDRKLNVSPDAVDAAIAAFKAPGAILWVDDQPDAIAREAAALRGLGAQVDVVTTNAQAIAKLGERDYAVVVSDIDRQASEGGKAGFYLPEQIQKATGQDRRVIFYLGAVTQRLIGGKHPATNSPVELLQLVSGG